ncbi:MAG: hypothetical protein ACTSXQ_03145 [Alphaproteobacteria bacterium]
MSHVNLKKQFVLFVFCTVLSSVAFSSPGRSSSGGIVDIFNPFDFGDAGGGLSDLVNQENAPDMTKEYADANYGTDAITLLKEMDRRTFTTSSDPNSRSVSGAVQVSNFARNTGNKVYIGVRVIIYTIAAFGMIALCIMGFFGKWSWAWFFGWCLALFLIGGVQALIDLLYYGNYPTIL